MPSGPLPFLYLARDLGGYSLWTFRPKLRSICGNRVFQGAGGEEPLVWFSAGDDPDHEVFHRHCTVRLKLYHTVKVRFAVSRALGDKAKRHIARSNDET